MVRNLAWAGSLYIPDLTRREVVFFPKEFPALPFPLLCWDKLLKEVLLWGRQQHNAGFGEIICFFASAVTCSPNDLLSIRVSAGILIYPRGLDNCFIFILQFAIYMQFKNKCQMWNIICIVSEIVWLWLYACIRYQVSESGSTGVHFKEVSWFSKRAGGIYSRVFTQS